MDQQKTKEIHKQKEKEIKTKNQTEKYKLAKSKSVSPKMSARSGLVGKNPLGPISCHFMSFFPMGRKNRKHDQILSIFLGGPMDPIHLRPTPKTADIQFLFMTKCLHEQGDYTKSGPQPAQVHQVQSSTAHWLRDSNTVEGQN